MIQDRDDRDARQPRRRLRAGAGRVRPPGRVRQAAGAGARAARTAARACRPSRRSIRPRSWRRSARRPTSGRSTATCWPGAPTPTEVLMVGGLAAISSGRNYAKLLAADAATSRFDAVMKSPRARRRRRRALSGAIRAASGRRGKGALDRGHRPLVRRRERQARRARTASSASSTSGTSRKSGSLICRASTA